MSDPLKPRHTPGPWRVQGPVGHIVTVGDPYGHGSMFIAQVRGWGHLTGGGACRFDADKAVAIQDANAQLIAAAPEMKDAIERFLTKWREVENRINDAVALQCIRTGRQYDGPTISAELDGLRKALAASEGREP